MPFNKVLIIRLSALGDVAMTIPVVYSLCRQYPATTFILLTRPALTRLFIERPANLQLFAAEVKGRHAGLRGLYTLYKDLRRLSVDAVADLHDVLRTKVLDLFFKMSGVPVARINKGRAEKKKLTSRRKPALFQSESSFDRYSDVFRKLGMEFSYTFHSLFSGRTGDAALLYNITPPKNEGEIWMGVAPFAKHKGKIYPIDKMEKVVAHFAGKEGYKVFLFGGGKEEQDILDQWGRKYPGIISLAGKRYGFELELTLISLLDVMISMDSANMHLASLVATPVISVWGATHVCCGFYGWNQSLNNCIQTDLSCRPCSVFGNKPCWRKDYACMESILPDEIINKIELLINKKRNSATQE